MNHGLVWLQDFKILGTFRVETSGYTLLRISRVLPRPVKRKTCHSLKIISAKFIHFSTAAIEKSHFTHWVCRSMCWGHSQDQSIIFFSSYWSTNVVRFLWLDGSRYTFPLLLILEYNAFCLSASHFVSQSGSQTVS